MTSVKPIYEVLDEPLPSPVPVMPMMPSLASSVVVPFADEQLDQQQQPLTAAGAIVDRTMRELHEAGMKVDNQVCEYVFGIIRARIGGERRRRRFGMSGNILLI